jgi:AcrR family transcriptional regulator
LIRFLLDEHANMLYAANLHPRPRAFGLAIFGTHRMSDWSLTYQVGECFTVRNCKKGGWMQPAKSPRALGKRALSRRSHVLETARRLFIEQGFHQTGIAQIATASGIAVGQIYRDFESKEEIIEAICQSDIESWLEEGALAEAVAAKDRDAIKRWLERSSAPVQFDDRCQLIAEIVAEAGRNPRVAEIYRQIDNRVRQSLSAALAALTQSGASTENIEVMAEHILRLGAGAVCRRITYPQHRDRQINDPVEKAIFNDLEQLLQKVDR